MSDNKRSKTSDRTIAKRRKIETRIPPGLDFINTLNDDCLSAIFKYLSIEDRLRVQAVCLRWRQNCASVWGDIRTLNLDNLPQRLRNNEAIETILRGSGMFLRQLKFDRFDSSDILQLVVKNCPNLQQLTISPPVAARNSTKWLSRMRKLKYLSLTGYSCQFSDDLFNFLDCKNLRKLELVAFRPRNSMGILKARMTPIMFERLPNLSNLYVYNFNVERDVLIFMSQCSKLTSIRLKWCYINEKYFECLNMASLEFLELRRMSELTDGFLAQISEACKKLKHLTLSSTPKITDAGLAQLQKLLQLEELHLVRHKQVTDEPFGGMHSLRRLTCFECPEVRDNGIIALMKNAPNLKTLHLQSSGVSARVLLEATEIAKERFNGVGLNIHVSRSVKREWKRLVKN